MKVLVMGSEDMVTAFRLIGVDGVVVRTGGELVRELRRVIAEKDVGVVFIERDLAEHVREELYSLKARVRVPVIMEVPGPRGEWVTTDLRALVKKALGVG